MGQGASRGAPVRQQPARSEGELGRRRGR
jgi:hypothetical protein